MENLKCIEIDFQSVKVDGQIQVIKLIDLLNHPPTEEERFPSSQILESAVHGLTKQELSLYFRKGEAVKYNFYCNFITVINNIVNNDEVFQHG